jgi:hypothetical protein
MPFATEHSPQKQNIPKMCGIFVQVEADSIDLTTTNGTTIISHHFSLERPSTRSCSFLLHGQALRWLRNALPKEGEITLSLARDEDPPILLVAMDGWIACCRSMEAIANQWKQILFSTQELEVTVSRQSLFRALTPFAARSLNDAQVMRLSVEDATLSMRLVVDGEIVLHRSIVLQHVGSPTHRSVLVDPKQLKRIVSAMPGTMLQLHIGHIERWEKQKRKRVGFIRVQSAQSTAMMSLSKRVRRPAQEVSPVCAQEIREHVPGHLQTSTAMDEEMVHEKERV